MCFHSLPIMVLKFSQKQIVLHSKAVASAWGIPLSISPASSGLVTSNTEGLLNSCQMHYSTTVQKRGLLNNVHSIHVWEGTLHSITAGAWLYQGEATGSQWRNISMSCSHPVRTWPWIESSIVGLSLLFFVTLKSLVIQRDQLNLWPGYFYLLICQDCWFLYHKMNLMFKPVVYKNKCRTIPNWFAL